MKSLLKIIHIKKIFEKLYSKNTNDNLELILDDKNTSNPYLAARTEWNFMFRDLIKAKRNWQVISHWLVVSNVVLIIGLIMISLQSKYIPYAVKVDSLGNTSFSGYMKAEQEISPLIVNAYIRRYISDARSVIADPIAQKQSLDYVYAVSRGESINFINEYYKTHDPFSKAQNATTEVQINAAIQKSPHTWQIDWTEIERNLDGGILNQSHYESLITVSHRSVTDAKNINVNPLGLFVTNLSWAQQS